MKNLLTYLFAILALVACSDSGTESGGNGGGGQEIPKQPEITLSTTAADFSTDGGSNVITFTSSEAWIAEIVNTRADDWCSIEPTSGPAGSAKITITTKENDTPDDRTASIIIKAGTASKTINVSQKQKDALTVTSSKFEVSAEGGEITIEVKANINFDFEIDEDAEDWITHRSTRALKTSQLVFEIDKNEDTENRKANISISSGNLRETVTIYQEGNEPTIILSDDEFMVSSSKETIAIDVKSNVDVSVDVSNNVNWIKENTTRAFSTNTYYFDIAQNDGYDARTAEIKFTNKENGIYEKVKITQMQRDAIVIAYSEYTFDENGGKLDFEIKTNVEFKVSISSDAQSWIKQVDTRGLQSKTLHFDIAANNTDNDREGVITLSGGDAKQTITVIQVVTPSQIIYTSVDGKIVTPNVEAFGNAKIVSNVYENGQGVITLDRTITSIPKGAFKLSEKLETICLPASAVSIGDSAFSDCSGLASVEMGDKIVNIGNNAFHGCSSLANIIIPESVLEIGAGAFSNCSSLKIVNIPISVTEIKNGTFARCSTMEEVKIQSNVVRIGKYAFNLCSSLRSISIPKSVTIIDDCAFYECSELVEVSIPNTVTTIGSYAFFSCKKLEIISIPELITEIKDGLFYGCSSIKSIVIPDKVEAIGVSAFCLCTELSSITVPINVKSIGFLAFSNCYNLSSVNCKPIVPPSLSWDTFAVCEKLSVINVPDEAVESYKSASVWSGYANKIVGYNFNNEDSGTVVPTNEIWYTSIDGNVVNLGFNYNGDSFGANIVSNVYENGKGVITFDGEVTKIADSAFSTTLFAEQTSTLQSITIPNSVNIIGDDAFQYCISLSNVVIPDGVEKIGSGAFSCCYNLTQISLPDDIQYIGQSAFACTGITSITIPENAILEENIVWGCDKLKSIYGRYASSDNRCWIVEDVLQFFAPAGLSEYTIPDGVTKIGKQSFSATHLSKITIPSSVTTIAFQAFDQCHYLESVIIPVGVKHIEGCAFMSCDELKDVTIPSSVTDIEAMAFSHCGNLEIVNCKPTTPPSITRLNGISSINIFNECNKLKTINVPHESVANYKNASGWSECSDKIVGYDFDGESGFDNPSGSEDDSDLENPEDGGTTGW